MHSQPFVIELLEDLVISQRAATLGGHRGLDYIPGQALLGACAARLYHSLGPDAYAVFHSGAVRFGNAFCLDPQGRPTWPMPLCWHHKKGESPSLPVQERLDQDRVFNLQHGEDPLAGAQPKQLREGYVNDAGVWVRPKRTMRMKTAIEPGTGRAAEAQFFGYDALPRGSRLAGWIEADRTIEDDLFAKIIAALSGTVLIGRSRSAEYGRAGLEPSGDEGFEPPEPGDIVGRELTLWLLSDLALADANGQPTLDPVHLGLGAVDWGASFLRTRRYAPWNGKRGSPDLERWVIQQGSVIRLRLDDEPNAAALIERCTAGLGLHRECGLGRVWINPPLLADLHPNFGKVIEPQIAPKPGDVADTADHPAASDPLILWLRSQVETEGNRERIETQAQAIAGEYRERLAAARRELGISKDELFGPSRSQWGSVLETARAKTGNELLGALFETKDAVVKTTGEGWKEEFFEKNRRVKLGDWLKTRLSAWVDPEAVPARSTRDFPRLVQRLAHLCRTDTEKRPQ